MSGRANLSLGSKLLFASGDYGCNLYWQSMTLFLLYFYTEVLALSPTQAGIIYMIASVVEGVVDPVIGALLDRRIAAGGQYRRWLINCAFPLGLLFVVMFWVPYMRGPHLWLVILACHIMFRLAYSLVAVPYAAITVQITDDPAERTTISGLRMMFSAFAADTIGFCFFPLTTFSSRVFPTQPYVMSGVVIASLATLALGLTSHTSRQLQQAPIGSSPTMRRPLLVLKNTEFLNLLLALIFAMISATCVSKSLIYYFKYVVHQDSRVHITLVFCNCVSLVAIPAWIYLGRHFGKQRQWLCTAGIGLFALVIFSLFRPQGYWGATLFFALMQAVTDGIGISYWSILPDTVEAGERRTGVHNEAILFGLFMFVQKAGVGIAAGLYGYGLSLIGYQTASGLTSVTAARLPDLICALCGAGLLGSAVTMFYSPMRNEARRLSFNAR